ncbi:hypothetical protein, partial [Aeromonas veronii]|uniref:hypothetical protein n=1 Tax=Aeromonas veronii TaxID=654 RepID=UPI00406BF288
MSAPSKQLLESGDDAAAEAETRKIVGNTVFSRVYRDLATSVDPLASRPFVDPRTSSDTSSELRQ